MLLYSKKKKYQIQVVHKCTCIYIYHYELKLLIRTIESSKFLLLPLPEIYPLFQLLTLIKT